MYVVFFVVSLAASIIGAVCGIGGGVLMKPILDSLGILNVSAISFLSGCTVLAMSFCALVSERKERADPALLKTETLLAFGAAAGGLGGKVVFEKAAGLFTESNRVGAVQAGCLLIITMAAFIYSIRKNTIQSRMVESHYKCIIIGLMLGVSSSFLGIGGGPINLVVLHYFFSMDTKQAARSSLYIIFFSQAAGLANTLVWGKLPESSTVLLIIMICGGLCGGAIGRFINKRINKQMVDKLFLGSMLAIMCINIYNIIQFTR